MKREDLFESMEHIDSRILERSQRPGPRRSKPVWMVAVAAVLVVILVAVAFLVVRRLLFGSRRGRYGSHSGGGRRSRYTGSRRHR